MKLIIMRHAEAEAAGVVPGGGDFERRLTETGRADAARMARLAQATGWQIARVRTSPLVRARETGSIVAETLGIASQTEPLLTSGMDPGESLSLFDGIDSNTVEIWVFHAPDVQSLSAELMGVRESAFYFTPGAMLALNLALPRPSGRGMLIWNAQPEYLRELL